MDDQQEREDFRPGSYRRDAEELEPGVEHERPIDEARDRGDFADPRVAQPGEAEEEEAGTPRRR
jgi:hypothetical protein